MSQSPSLSFLDSGWAILAVEGIECWENDQVAHEEEDDLKNITSNLRMNQLFCRTPRPSHLVHNLCLMYLCSWTYLLRQLLDQRTEQLKKGTKNVRTSSCRILNIFSFCCCVVLRWSLEGQPMEEEHASLPTQDFSMIQSFLNRFDTIDIIRYWKIEVRFVCCGTFSEKRDQKTSKCGGLARSYRWG